MRTTVDIPDSLYRQLKVRAAARGGSVKSLILQAVEQALTRQPASVGRRVKLPIVRSKRPGRLRIDNDRIYDVISFP